MIFISLFFLFSLDNVKHHQTLMVLPVLSIPIIFFGSFSTFGTFFRSHIETSFKISEENNRQVMIVDAY